MAGAGQSVKRTEQINITNAINFTVFYLNIGVIELLIRSKGVVK